MVLHFDKNNVCCEKVYYSEALLSPSVLYNMIEGSYFLYCSVVTILGWLFSCLEIQAGLTIVSIIKHYISFTHKRQKASRMKPNQ